MGDAAGEIDRAATALSRWIDSSPNYRDLPEEAALWRRVVKVQSEGNEAVDALYGLLGENPRKGVTHERADLVRELLDAALAALAAVEHVTGNAGGAVELLRHHAASVVDRAEAHGLVRVEPPAAEHDPEARFRVHRDGRWATRHLGLWTLYSADGEHADHPFTDAEVEGDGWASAQLVPREKADASVELALIREAIGDRLVGDAEARGVMPTLSVVIDLVALVQLVATPGGGGHMRHGLYRRAARAMLEQLEPIKGPSDNLDAGLHHLFVGNALAQLPALRAAVDAVLERVADISEIGPR